MFWKPPLGLTLSGRMCSGILFQDIFPVFRNPQGVAALIEELLSHLNTAYTQRGTKIDVIIGLDSRGFLFGPMLATALNCAFVPIRKRHKLPGKVEFVEYIKEYGKVTPRCGCLLLVLCLLYYFVSTIVIVDARRKPRYKWNQCGKAKLA